MLSGSMNYMILENSTYSARLRYSCDIVSIINVFPLGGACLNNMIKIVCMNI